MVRSRDVCALIIVIALSFGVNMYYVYATGPNWDETFHVKASLHDPGEYYSAVGQGYSIDHPTLKRYIYRAVLHARGITSIKTPDVDYHQTPKWNIENGRTPQLDVVLPLRITNAVFMTAAVVLVFLTALLLLGNGYLAVLVLLPLVLSERIGIGVVGYVGCDAILAFFLALSLFVFTLLVLTGKASSLLGVLALGVVGGLATSAKFNGALVVVAFVVYLVIYNRGIDRLARPFLMTAVAVVVFVILNPVMRGGGLGWAIGIVWDMLKRRRTIWMSQYEEVSLTRFQLVARFFPYAAFVYAGFAALVALRRKKWAVPLFIWSAALVLGTLLSVNRTYRRYFLPVEMATFTAAGIFAWALLGEYLPRGVHGWHTLGGLLKKASKPAAVAVAAVLVMFTFAAAVAPWGPSRLRFGISPVRKTLLFYRQAAAYYGFAEPLGREEVGEFVKPPSTGRRAANTRLPRPLFSSVTRWQLSFVVFLAGVVVVFLACSEVLDNRWLGLAAVLPFVWTELGEGRWRLFPASECYLFFFTAAALYVWLAACRNEGSPGWRTTFLLAVCTGGAAAAAPRGTALVAAVAVYVFLSAHKPGRILRAGLVIAVAVASYAVLEPVLWYIGAREPLDFVQGMFGGLSSHWTHKFAGRVDFLMPLLEDLPYWPLLPLGGVVLYLVRRERWALPLALYGGFAVAAAILGVSATANSHSVDMDLALTVVAGVPALALLARHIELKVRFKEPPAAPACGGTH